MLSKSLEITMLRDFPAQAALIIQLCTETYVTTQRAAKRFVTALPILNDIRGSNKLKYQTALSHAD